MLWGLDKLGAPTNATNFIRDVPNATKYKAGAAVSASAKTVWDYVNGNESNFDDNYEFYTKNPSLLQRYVTIEPLSNNNGNYSEEEMNVIKDMAGTKNSITNADILRVSGRYGGQGSIFSYLTSPDKVVQTSIGQTSGENGRLHDIYDFNVGNRIADRDNKMYLDSAKTNPGFDYFTLRGIAPSLGSTSDMPDNYKLKTNLFLRD